jgi:hypothetical protein
MDRDQRKRLEPGELEQLPESTTKISHPLRMLQFRSLPNYHMLEITIRKSPIAMKTPHASTGSKKRPMKNSRNTKEAAAAELALKAHVLRSNPEILAELTEGDRIMREMRDRVDLTEAPEDAVCSLVIDLLQYCEREKIDWTQEVMSRAWAHFRGERAYEVQKR